MCTQSYILIRTYNLCNRPRVCCLSFSRLPVTTSQFSLALANAVLVFIKLWYSDVKISLLGGWASQWRPPQLYNRLSHREWLHIKGWLEECLNFYSEQICKPFTVNKFPSVQIRAMGDEAQWLQKAPITGVGGNRAKAKQILFTVLPWN
jgi:hypothetical protein